jgi:hypothetical protein
VTKESRKVGEQKNKIYYSMTLSFKTNKLGCNSPQKNMRDFRLRKGPETLILKY